MNIAIQWQDADSSSAKAVTDHFPDAEIMICGGHAGRAHKKQLEKLQKMKSSLSGSSQYLLVLGTWYSFCYRLPNKMFMSENVISSCISCCSKWNLL